MAYNAHSINIAQQTPTATLSGRIAGAILYDAL